MERGNGNTVLLTVIGVATLLVALVGATFAYFTASINTSNDGIVNVTTSQLSGLTVTSAFSGTQSPLYPGWVGYQYVDVEATGASTTSTAYSLVLTVAGSGTGVSALLGDVQYAACKVTGANGAAATADFAASTLATATVNSAGTQYYMENGDVQLPATCTAITADVASPYTSGTTLDATGDKTLTSYQEIVGGTHDKYYIIYRYLNKEDQSTQMGANFTVTPAVTVVPQTTPAP